MNTRLDIIKKNKGFIVVPSRTAFESIEFDEQPESNSFADTTLDGIPVMFIEGGIKALDKCL